MSFLCDYYKMVWSPKKSDMISDHLRNVITNDHIGKSVKLVIKVIVITKVKAVTKVRVVTSVRLVATVKVVTKVKVAIKLHL